MLKHQIRRWFQCLIQFFLKNRQSEIEEIARSINKLTEQYKFEFRGTLTLSTSISDAPNDLSIELTIAEVNSQIEKQKASPIGLAINGFTITVLLAWMRFLAGDILNENLSGVINIIGFIGIIIMIYILYKGYRSYLTKIKDLTSLKNQLDIYLNLIKLSCKE
ncbi:hypothetical protein [Psychrobacillus vulpis]|uniref:Uncharacterized protein n=1 Tax=Psychrobacillus vulpis TaxID=2325572 RepID=A0A544TUW3_9BACI|nr:hypothetical protein [Psychrobacillus vulpis]TQR21234.1 hypothetical protein FG384_03230 [Psychrobacillus vulpis]